MISGIIYVAVGMLKKVEFADDLIILSKEMYRSEPDKNNEIGMLGVDIEINGVKTFLSAAIAEDMICYPNGMFIATEFVYGVLNPIDDQNTFFNEQEIGF